MPGVPRRLGDARARRPSATAMPRASARRPAALVRARATRDLVLSADSAAAGVRASLHTQSMIQLPRGGGGDGGESRCSWRPIGPIAQVQAAQAAINAAQTPERGPADAGRRGERAGHDHPGRRQHDVVRGHRHDGPGARRLRLRRPRRAPRLDHAHPRHGRQPRRRRSPPPTSCPAPTTRSCAGSRRRSRGSVRPTRTPPATPSSTCRRSSGSTARPASGTRSRRRRRPGASASRSRPSPCASPSIPATATHPCRAPASNRCCATPSRTGGFPAADTCSYRYLDSSAMAPNGRTWPVTVAITWHATWTANTGQRRRPRPRRHDVAGPGAPRRRDPGRHHPHRQLTRRSVSGAADTPPAQLRDRAPVRGRGRSCRGTSARSRRPRASRCRCRASGRDRGSRRSRRAAACSASSPRWPSTTGRCGPSRRR